MQQSPRSGTEAMESRAVLKGSRSGKGPSMLQPDFREAQILRPTMSGHMPVRRAESEALGLLPGAGIGRGTYASDTVDGVGFAGGSHSGSECSSDAVAGLGIYAAEISSDASTPTSAGLQPVAEPPKNPPSIANGTKLVPFADKMPFTSVFNKGDRLSTVLLVDKLKDQIPRPPPGLRIPLNKGAKSFVPRCNYPPAGLLCSARRAAVPPPR